MKVIILGWQGEKGWLMGLATLDTVTGNFRQDNVSEEETFDHIWVKRTDYVKTWYQKIHPRETMAVKIIMRERPGSFISSGKKGSCYYRTTVCQRRCSRWWGLKRSQNTSHVALCSWCKGIGILLHTQWEFIKE